MLQVLGLTSAEQEIYEHLVRGSAMTSAEIDDSLGRGSDRGGRLDSARALVRLHELGLVSRLPGEPVRWSARPPGAALEALIGAHVRALADASRHVADLDSRFNQVTHQEADELVEVVHGRDAIVRRGAEAQRSARKQIRACDGPPYPAANPAALDDVEVDQLRQGIRYRILYDRRSLEVPGRLADLEAGIAAGEEARLTDIPVKMTLIDDTLAVLPLHQPADVESRLIVHDPVLVSALSALFEVYWERALPLRSGPGQPYPSATGPSAAEARLLPLLVAGLTDQEIAGQLDISDRTIRNRMHALLDRLDAATRFQAGFQAVVRGWLATDDLPAPDTGQRSGAAPGPARSGVAADPVGPGEAVAPARGGGGTDVAR
ncbi:LuxR C-terminal-related transcriptional regulator [Micromonospora sp. NBC_01655]|uniref:helix-turn-helix transcriptional regulator n=1 Tax=Micromonospora sp. NBC_01655 TaxID=2975983 RepID=UPI00225BBF0C|nr:LuxR family transcriptional regulator [Micromonospora sp. NBC_01655]MCX4471430.1 LuxR C-terminal-related transcriptional regulator [Micromonospora sp. NBC_01655]